MVHWHKSTIIVPCMYLTVLFIAIYSNYFDIFCL